MTNKITTNGITDEAIFDRVPVNQVYSETFTRDTDFTGTSPTFTLSQTPISSTHVFVNMGSASLIDEDLTIVDNTVVVDSGVPLDVEKVQIKYISPNAVDVSNISDGVVTYNKTAAGLRGSATDITNDVANKFATTDAVNEYVAQAISNNILIPKVVGNINGINGTLRLGQGISGVTRLASGDYRVDFENNFANTNYVVSVNGTTYLSGDANYGYGWISDGTNTPGYRTTSSFRFQTGYLGSAQQEDISEINIVVYGDLA